MHVHACERAFERACMHAVSTYARGCISVFLVQFGANPFCDLLELLRFEFSVPTDATFVYDVKRDQMTKCLCNVQCSPHK